MISIGLFSLALATVDHRRNMRAMQAEFGIVARSTSALVATLVSVLGIVALVVVALRG